MTNEDVVDLGHCAEDVVEADPRQADPGLVLAARFGHEDDGLPRTEDIARVLGEASVEPDVDRPPQVTRGEGFRRPTVDDDRAVDLCLEGSPEVHGHDIDVVVQQLALTTVRVGGEREVERSDGLAPGHRFDEGILAHGRQGVVRTPLLADRRPAGGRQVLAARGASAVRRIDPCRVGECQELVVHRSVQAARQSVGRPPDRGQQVGAADVTDEERVAREHTPWLGVPVVLPHDDRDRLRRVARCVTDLESHIAERHALTVAQWIDREVGMRLVAVGDGRARGCCELEVARQEVGVEVGLDHALDAQVQPISVGEVLRHVALWVDDDGSPRALVAHQVAEQ